MEWEPEQDLGGLGLTGICCEILRVLRARCWSLAPVADAYVFGVADFLGLQLLVLDAPDAIALPLQLLAGAAYLAGMVSLAVVLHLSWVASVLATGFGAMRRSRALLAGKLWPAVYLVCKSYHQEVVDAANLAYVGEFTRLDDDGNNGVELQTEQELTATT